MLVRPSPGSSVHTSAGDASSTQVQRRPDRSVHADRLSRRRAGATRAVGPGGPAAREPGRPCSRWASCRSRVTIRDDVGHGDVGGRLLEHLDEVTCLHRAGREHAQVGAGPARVEEPPDQVGHVPERRERSARDPRCRDLEPWRHRCARPRRCGPRTPRGCARAGSRRTPRPGRHAGVRRPRRRRRAGHRRRAPGRCRHGGAVSPCSSPARPRRSASTGPSTGRLSMAVTPALLCGVGTQVPTHTASTRGHGRPAGWLWHHTTSRAASACRPASRLVPRATEASPRRGRSGRLRRC